MQRNTNDLLNLSANGNEGITKLKEAITKRDEKSLKTLLNAGANPYLLDKENKSALYYAVDRYIQKLKGSSQILDDLLASESAEIKLETDFFENYDQHGIYKAIVANDVSLTERLFQKIGKDNAKTLINEWQNLANYQAFDCNDPLHIAIAHNNVDMVNLLLKHGANPYKISAKNYHALSLAITLGHESIVDVILNYPVANMDKLTVAATLYAAADKNDSKMFLKIVQHLQANYNSKVINEAFEMFESLSPAEMTKIKSNAMIAQVLMDYSSHQQPIDKSNQISILPNELVNEYIQYLGMHYLMTHGTKANLLHRNQAIALQLKHYNQQTGIQAKWQFLADIYAKLPNHNGMLAKKLIELFENAFHLEKIDIKKLSVPEVAKRLSDEVSQFFKLEKQNRLDLQIPHDNTFKLSKVTGNPSSIEGKEVGKSPLYPSWSNGKFVSPSSMECSSLQKNGLFAPSQAKQNKVNTEEVKQTKTSNPLLLKLQSIFVPKPTISNEKFVNKKHVARKTF